MHIFKLVRNQTRSIFWPLTVTILVYGIFSTHNASAFTIGVNDNNTHEFCNSSTIKSIKLHKLGWELSDPIIELNSPDKVVLLFDDLAETPGNYSYSISHCDADWNPSSLFLNDYIEGFEVNEIRNYSYSTGTVNSYLHCKLELPNDDVKLKISGNYLIKIFDTYEPENIILQRRFFVYEPLVVISASIKQPSGGEKRLTSQQLNLKVQTKGVRVINPHSELKTVVCQNQLSQGCHTKIDPVHFSGNEIDYSKPDGLIFDGGNEFRLFDTKNLRYFGQGIRTIDYATGEFHVQLNADNSRSRYRYSYYPDFNGKYIINLERSTQSHIEADYAWVYFTLRPAMELDEGKSVYLFGEFTGCQLSPQYKMNFNPERNTYELRLLLKQGAYNYRYLVANEASAKVDISYFEGNYFETENAYTILVYYKPLGSRFDRIVGFQKISSNK
ncbi:MAG: DUF5103 domain-containing protein [Bacteroidales bacterium]